MARFRLRFLLQEIDLREGETLIGRSGACHVTLQDALVSRQHARIRVTGGRATLEDLGSRNGLLLNERPVTGVVQLADGDRIRIGAQDLVVCQVGSDEVRRTGRSTGFLTHCSSCGHPFSADLVVCPVCGSEQREENTLTGSRGRADWSIELAGEALDRATALGRWDDAERLLHRARLQVEQRLASDEPPAEAPIDRIAAGACRVAAARASADWARWALTLYAALERVPPAALLERVAELPRTELGALEPVVGRLREQARARGDDDAAEQALARLLTEGGA